MTEQFLKSITQECGVGKADKLLLACSGGVDSVALFHLLRNNGFHFEVAHCNYGLRSESDQDEQFVKNLCAEHNILFHGRKFDLKKEKSGRKMGTQEAARTVRYEWFHEILAERKLKYVLTAHHADDVVETMLFNLSRGTGARGLSGISSVNDLIIRPLLRIWKNDLLDYVSDQYPYVEDISNHSNTYDRNLIRNKVIPLLSKVNSAAKSHIRSTADVMREEHKIVELALKSAAENCSFFKKEDLWIDIAKLKDFVGIKSLLLFMLEPFGFRSSQLEEVIDLMDSQSGKKLHSTNFLIIRDREHLIVSKIKSNGKDAVLIQKDTKSSTISCSILAFSEVDRSEFSHPNIAFFDASKLSFPLTLRAWQQGDKFRPFGMNGKQKVSDLLVQKKIPLHEKSRVQVLCAGEKIIWVLGLRVADGFRVENDVKEVLRVEWEG